MPGRKTPLITNQVYHIVNRGVANQPIFINKRDYDRLFYTMLYYQNKDLPLRYSFYAQLPIDRKKELLNKLKVNRSYLVNLIAYCYMPNHIHLLLKQLEDDGISSFMANLANSYTKYFNIKHSRQGHLFQGKFKSILIDNDNQLTHVTRYIHLNPYSSHIVKTIKDLENYQYSSLPEYLNQKNTSHCDKDIIMSILKTVERYKKFVFDQADYQKKLEQIKHLINF